MKAIAVPADAPRAAIVTRLEPLSLATASLASVRTLPAASPPIVMLFVDSERDTRGLLRALEDLDRGTPYVTPVVCLRSLPEDLAYDLVRRLGLLGLCGGIVSAADPDEIRAAVTSRVPLTPALLAWLRRRRPGLPSGVWSIISAALQDDEPAALALQAKRSSRASLARADLPSPRQWRALGDVLRALLEMQSGNEPIEVVARRSRYSSASALSRASVRTLGRRPGSIRESLGWRWLAWRFLRIHRVA